MSEIFRIYDDSEDRACSKCHKIKRVYCFRIDGRIFKTCNSCRYRARELRRDRSPAWPASLSDLLPASASSSPSEPTLEDLQQLAQSLGSLFISSSSSSASASYFVKEPEEEPEPDIRKKVRGLADM